jgi:peptidoglycan/LPS O-acetylase OafA/YrhL
LIIASSTLSFFPWQQRFFSAEMMFFAVGMLSFRRSTEIGAFIKSGWASLFIVSASIIFGGWFMQDLAWYNSVIVAAGLYIALPATFALTSRSLTDRLIGEFSYPIYLVHITIGYFVKPAQHLWFGGFLLILSIIAAAPLVFLVERPLEQWRNSRLRAVTRKPHVQSASFSSKL